MLGCRTDNGSSDMSYILLSWGKVLPFLPRPGSPQKTLPLQLSSTAYSVSHSPLNKWRNRPPRLPNVVLPGSSPGPPTQICFWIPCYLCHTYFQTQHFGDLSPFLVLSVTSLMRWAPPKLLPWRWHTSHCPGWLLLHIWHYTLHRPTGLETNSTLSLQGPVIPRHSTPLTAFDHHFLSPLKIHHFSRPYTSHSHYLPQSEIPLSLCSLLYCSFPTIIHRSIRFNV